MITLGVDAHKRMHVGRRSLPREGMQPRPTCAVSTRAPRRPSVQTSP